MIRFTRFELRTTEVAAARAFYAAVLGEGRADIVPLPEEAVARGARTLWLGHLGVRDVEGAARAFVERGATRLGPTRPAQGGGEVAILRDPGGALVAVATPPPAPQRAGVVWHELDTADLAGALESYRALFGWQLTERLDLGALGVHQHFAWREGGASVGSMADVAGLPGGVHPQWVFHFRVAALEPALEAVRAGGGIVLGLPATVGGGRIAVCDDPQGAGFALRECAPEGGEGGAAPS